MGQIVIDKDVGGFEGLCVIIPQIHGDDRGYFMEVYNGRDMANAGLDIRFVQDNQSFSTRGVLRGLHFQKHYPQTKLVRVLRGEIYDVVLDLREGSKTYGKWHGELLSAENRKQFLIPRGFAHGFLVLSEAAEILYKCDDYYHPNDEGGIAWNDPQNGIVWPGLEGEYRGSPDAAGYTVNGAPLVLSEKDQKWPGFRDAFKF